MNKPRTMITIFSLLALASFGVAQEHPEHPKKAEHPEHPAETKTTFKVDVDAMEAAITGYVDGDCKLKGGFFMVFDTKSKKALTLTLSKVHKEKLAKVGENLYFACSDFNSAGGKVFDLDFFMQETDGELVVTEVMIHKEDGSPRYTWFEEEGLWQTKQVD
ncbi:MAG: hypothetical protein IH914_04995 [candidate division Zixibacteria bacterium]|nr:hypothetical protein [candidate division Zixibacteria bacterium]